MTRYLLFPLLFFTACREHPQRPSYNNAATAEEEMLREASDLYLRDTVPEDSLLYLK